MNSSGVVRIGGGSGYWGDADFALPQLLEAGVDYVVFDYLAEITMSILARARTKSADAGYATDFITGVIEPNLERIANQGVKILANAGGVNPLACSAAIERCIKDKGLTLTVATITGDDLSEHAAEFIDTTEMFSGESFPDVDSVQSINAYLGAFPIAMGLAQGADIIITGRCVDSALTLAVGIHEFGWQASDWNHLAAGSLAGHLIECGNQVAGGNHTDWQSLADTIDTAGYPIAELEASGDVTITKPAGSGGKVTTGTVAEQLLYEIGDPGTYLLPDVTCDFTQVEISDLGSDRVLVRGARGRAAPSTCKVSATYADGWRIITLWFFIGKNSRQKAEAFANAAVNRSNRKLKNSNLGEYSEIQIETFGAGSHFSTDGPEHNSREVTLRLSARHTEPAALRVLLKEASGLALATPPGMALFTGGRPSPSPVVRLFSLLVDKDRLTPCVNVNGKITQCPFTSTGEATTAEVHTEPHAPETSGSRVPVSLRRLAWARSGDKGNSANIGVIPRHQDYAPFLWEQLTETAVADIFSHFLDGEVERFYLPGTASMNLLMHDVLGGGGIASLRTDTQGKSYGEILLETEITIPEELLKEETQ